MRRSTISLAVVAVLALLGSGCGPAGSGSLGRVAPSDPPAAGPAPGGPIPARPAGPAAPASPRPSGPAGPSEDPDRTVTIRIWLTRAGQVFPASRTRPHTVATSRLALTELVAGPTAVEQAAGLRTGLAAGTRFEVSIASGVATVDLPGGFYTGGREAARLRQAQVVFTLTEFPSVSRIGFQSGGRPQGAPVGRADYDDLLPLIVVTSPVIGQRVTSPVTVAGTANVFEATVSIRILDQSGAPLASTFTTATCGTGCRGHYTTAVGFRVPAEQPGTVQVYEVSAEHGRPIHIVDLPVTLVPGR